MAKSQTARPTEGADETPSELAVAQEAPEQEEAPEHPNKGKFIEHIPQEGFGARVILKQDWRSLGVEGEDVEWNKFNHFRLPAEQFNEGQLRYLLEVDDGFELV